MKKRTAEELLLGKGMLAQDGDQQSGRFDGPSQLHARAVLSAEAVLCFENLNLFNIREAIPPQRRLLLTQHMQSRVCCNARNSVTSAASSSAELCSSPVPALHTQRGSSPRSCVGMGLCKEQPGVRRLSLLLPTTMLGRNLFPQKG